MAFFGLPALGARGDAAARASSSAVSVDFLHRHECAACPLNAAAGLQHPKMEPTGAERPDIYFLGEAPGDIEDRRGRQMVGPAGQIVRHHLPEKWSSRARWNNCIRSRPPGNRPPSYIEVECCRPSIIQDIMRTRPKAILGFGNVPLSWAGIASSGIAAWCGRRVPVKIGSHVCWFFPLTDPSTVLRDPKWRGLQRRAGKYGSELEFRFALDLRAVLAAVDAGLPDPIVHSSEDALEGIEWVTGANGDADVETVEDFLYRAARRKLAGFDYETNCLRPYAAGAKILSAAVSTAMDGTLVFPFDHREAQWTGKQRARIDVAWRKFLHESRCRKVSHHLAFEMEWSAYFYGADCLHSGRWGCSISQLYVLDERQGATSLEALVVAYFGINIKKLAAVNRAALDDESLPKVLQYNGMDAKYHLALYIEQRRELRARGLERLYHEHLARVPTVVLTQLKGIPINQDVVRELGEKYILKMAEIEDELRALSEVRQFERATGGKFRPTANDDVRYVVNKILGHKLSSVDEDSLAAVDHDFARLELSWRKRAKLLGTYIIPVADEESRRALSIDDVKKPPHVFPDGKLHPITSVNRTRTSRTGSEDPNYQNWPKRGGNNAVELRRVVAPSTLMRPDLAVVSFDYGQIQARNVGMESLDNALLKAFWEDYDIHFDFMEHLARIYPRWIKEGVRELVRKDDVGKKLVKKYRNDVKHGFVFASFFGAGANKVANVLNIPVSVAEKLVELFDDRFGGIGNWHERLERDYYRTGYVTGHSGYRRHAPVSYNERINAPIQGDEAKIVLDAMERLSRTNHDHLQASMEIHDDLTFIWEKKRIDELADIVIRAMLETPFEWAKVTPIVVEMSVGENWSALKEIGTFSSNKYGNIDMPRRRPK